jgi:hypothetical protein
VEEELVLGLRSKCFGIDRIVGFDLSKGKYGGADFLYSIQPKKSQ